MDDLVLAIRSLHPEAEFSYTNQDYSTIKWDILDGEPPTQKEIDEAIKKVKADKIKEAKEKATAKAAILDRIGLTADELKTILG
jgi:hypothetical protein